MWNNGGTGELSLASCFSCRIRTILSQIHSQKLTADKKAELLEALKARGEDPVHTESVDRV